MARLPSSGDVQRVGIARQPGVRAPASLISAGAGLSDVAGTLGAIAADMKIEQERAAAKQQALRDGTAITEGLIGFGRESMTELTRLRTEGDFSDPATLATYQVYLNKRRDAILSTLPHISPEAMEELRLKLMQQAATIYQSAEQLHLGAINDRASLVWGEQVNVLGQQASLYPDGLDDILASLDTALDPFRPAMTAAQEQENIANARASVIGAAIDARIVGGDFAGARAILESDSYAGDIDPGSRDVLTRRIQDQEEQARREAEREAEKQLALTRARLSIQIDDATAAAQVTGSDPFAEVPVGDIVAAYGEDAVYIVRDMQAAQQVGMAQSQVDEAFASGGPAAVTTLLNEIEIGGENARNEIEVQSARQAAAKSLVFDAALNNQIARLGEGQGVDPAFEGLARTLLGDPVADRLMGQLAFAAEQADAGRAIDGATLDELYAIVSDPAAVDPTDPLFAQRVEGRDLLRQQAVETAEALQADPFAYVARNADRYAGVEEATATLSDPAADPSDRAAALGLVVEAQRTALGPGNERFVSVMGDGQAAAFVGELQTASPTEWPMTISGFVDSFGRYRNRAVADLVAAGLPAEARVFAFYGDDIAARPQLTRLATILDEGGRETLAQAVKKTPQAADMEQLPETIAGALQDFGLSLAASGSGGGTTTYNAIASSVELLALDDMRRGVPMAQAVETHAAALVNDRYDFVQDGASTYRVDTRFDVDKVEGVARETLDAIQPDDLMLPGGAPQGLTDADVREAFYNAVQNGGRWVTNESDDGLVLLMPGELGGLPVLRADGSRIEVLFADAERRDINELPTAPDPTKGMSFMGIPIPAESQ